MEAFVILAVDSKLSVLFFLKKPTLNEPKSSEETSDTERVSKKPGILLKEEPDSRYKSELVLNTEKIQQHQEKELGTTSLIYVPFFQPENQGEQSQTLPDLPSKEGRAASKEIPGVGRATTKGNCIGISAGGESTQIGDLGKSAGVKS